MLRPANPPFDIPFHSNTPIHMPCSDAAWFPVPSFDKRCNDEESKAMGVGVDKPWRGEATDSFWEALFDSVSGCNRYNTEPIINHLSSSITHHHVHHDHDDSSWSWWLYKRQWAKLIIWLLVDRNHQSSIIRYTTSMIHHPSFIIHHPSSPNLKNTCAMFCPVRIFRFVSMYIWPYV